MKYVVFLGALSAFSSNVWAADQKEVEEVIVTADFHHKPLLKTSLNVSVVDELSIQKKSAKHIEDLINHIPNVNFSSGASRGRFFQIRGIGERSQFVDPLNPSVGLIIDGIDFTGVGGAATTFDVSQVEVFRGPQGTLFGANALAGIINIISNDASQDLTGYSVLEVGNDQSQRIGGAVGAGLFDDWRFRVAIESNKSDGYYDNAYLNRDDTNNIDETTSRIKLAYQPSDDIEIKLTGFYADVDNGYDAFTLDNTRTTLSDQPGHDRLKTKAFGLSAIFSGYAGYQFEFDASHASSDTEYGYDEDWTFRTICSIESDCAFRQYSTFDNYDRDFTNNTLDFRFVSKQTDLRYDWVVGFYIKSQNEQLTRTYINNDPTYGTFYGPIVDREIDSFYSTYDSDNFAFYTQFDFDLSESWSFGTGIRIESRAADYTDSDAFDNSQDEDLWGGKLSLEFSGIKNTLLYGLVSRGYKAGGVNPTTVIPEEERNFTTGELLNYELGIKGSGLDNNLNGQLAIFYQDQKSAQVKQSYVFSQATGNPFDGDENSCPCDFEDYTSNAPKISSYGVEAEMSYQVGNAFSVWSNIGLLSAEFDEYQSYSHVDADAENGISKDLAGRTLAQAPEYQYVIGTEWAITQMMNWEFTVEGKDSFKLSNRHEAEAGDYTLLNTRIKFDFDVFELALWGKNLTDEDVIVRGFGSFPNDPRDLYTTNGPYYQFGSPRTVGITGKYTF